MTVGVIGYHGRMLVIGAPVDDGFRGPCDLCHITLAQVRVDSGELIGDFCAPCVESAVWEAMRSLAKR